MAPEEELKFLPNPLQGRGNTQSPKLMFVSEMPSENDINASLMLSGDNGELIRELIAQAGVSENECYFTSVGKYFLYKDPPPSENGWKRKYKVPASLSELPLDQLEVWKAHFFQELAAIRPQMIIPLGGSVLPLLGIKGKISTARSNIFDVRPPNDTTGTICYKAVPTWHPSYPLKGTPTAKFDMMSDLQYALNSLGGGRPKPTKNYCLLYDVDLLRQYVDKVLAGWQAGTIPYIVVDIETEYKQDFDPNSRIITVQLTHEAHQGVWMPFMHLQFGWDPLYLLGVRSELKRLLESGIPVSNQNLKFDYRWLYAKMGIDIRNIFFDTMLAQRFLYADTRPADLGSLTSMYLGIPNYKREMEDALGNIPRRFPKCMDWVPISLLEEYGCADSDYTWQITQILLTEMKSRMSPVSQYDLFMSMVIGSFKAVAKMELDGAFIDTPVQAELIISYPEQMKKDLEPIVAYLAHLRAWVNADINNMSSMGTILSANCTYSLAKDKPLKTDEKMYNAAWRMILSAETLGLHSNTDSVAFVFGVLGIKPKYFGKDGPSSAEGVIEEHIDDLNKSGTEEDKAKSSYLRAMMKYRGNYKLFSSYIAKYKDHLHDKGEEITIPGMSTVINRGLPNTLHSVYNLAGTKSGRLSCNDPSLQVLPPKSDVKRMFASRFPGGLILQGDESQLEVRVFAAISGDAELIQAFNDDKDVHMFVATKIYKVSESQISDEMRRSVKPITFALLYGAGASKIARDLGITLEEATKLYNDYFDAFPSIRVTIRNLHLQAMRELRTVSPCGRIRPLPELAAVPQKLYDAYAAGEIDQDNRKYRVNGKCMMDFKHWTNVAQNHPIQSSASDLVMYGMSRYQYANWEKKSVMFSQVHDSVGWETFNPEIFDIMDSSTHWMTTGSKDAWSWMNVPLKFDLEVGANWGRPCKISSWDTSARKMRLKGPVDYVDVLLQKIDTAYHVNTTDLKLIPAKVKDGKIVEKEQHDIWVHLGDLK